MNYIISGKKFLTEEKNLLCLRFYEMASTKHPEMFVGFDFVAYEDDKPLSKFKSIVTKYKPENPNFKPTIFYHAGESYQRENCNCIIAIKNGSKRLGHGLGLMRDPRALAEATFKGVLVECCPISNWVLGYVSDLKWHPVQLLKKRGIPFRWVFFNYPIQ